MTELERLKVLSALKLGYGKLTARNTTEAEFKNIEDAIELIERTKPVNVDLGDVSGLLPLSKVAIKSKKDGYTCALLDGKNLIATQGKTVDELFINMADAYKAIKSSEQ